MASQPESSTATPSKKPAYVGFPENYDELSPEEQEEVRLEMARALQKQLGIKPNA